MELRSTTSRGAGHSLNISRGRGKRLETPTPLSVGEGHDFTSRPLVVHSPASCARQITYPLDDINANAPLSSANSPPYTSNFVIESDQAQATGSQIIAHTITKRSSSDTTTLYGFPDNQIFPNMTSNSENQVPNDPTFNTVNENLLAAVQQTISLAHEEFRSEIASLRATISSLSQNTNSNIGGLPSSENSHRQNPLDNTAPPLATNDRNKIDVEKWKVNYNGTGNVADFLFKVDTLRNRTKCSDEHLLANFQIFLSGKAEVWYWEFIKQNDDPSYAFLKYSISQEFGLSETDDDILLKIRTRKQQQKESYDDFHSAVVSMNARLREPLSDNRLMAIIKSNVNTNLKLMLFNVEPRSLQSLRERARGAEKILLEGKVPLIPNSRISRQVNEIEVNSVDDEVNEAELDPQIEALRFPRRNTPPDYSKIKCWNCLALGHSYIYCPDEVRHKFCYKCGERGVVTTSCKNDHLGNRKRSELATGDSRSQAPTPSS